jgi:hypothetical protein
VGQEDGMLPDLFEGDAFLRVDFEHLGEQILHIGSAVAGEFLG